MSERTKVLATEILPDDIVVGLEYPVRAMWVDVVHMDCVSRAVFIADTTHTVVLEPTRTIEVVRGV